MTRLLGFLLALLTSTLQTRASLHAEFVALRHQFAPYQGRGARPRISPAERLLWSGISRLWSGWRAALYFVKPGTAMGWQNPYAERVIKSIRREFLDHMVVLSERYLKRLLSHYVVYNHEWRLHRPLDMDVPDPRSEWTMQPDWVVKFPAVQVTSSLLPATRRTGFRDVQGYKWPGDDAQKSMELVFDDSSQ